MLYTSRNKQCVSLLEWALVAHVYLVPKEKLILIGGGAPALKQCQVSRSRTDQVENLFTLSQKHEKALKCEMVKCFKIQLLYYNEIKGPLPAAHGTTQTFLQNQCGSQCSCLSPPSGSTSAHLAFQTQTLLARGFPPMIVSLQSLGFLQG